MVYKSKYCFTDTRTKLQVQCILIFSRMEKMGEFLREADFV